MWLIGYVDSEGIINVLPYQLKDQVKATELKDELDRFSSITHYIIRP